jgi:hypothetical protein
MAYKAVWLFLTFPAAWPPKGGFSMIRSIFSATLMAAIFASGTTLRGDEPAAGSRSPVTPAPQQPTPAPQRAEQAVTPAPQQAGTSLAEPTVAPIVIEQPAVDVPVVPVRRYGYWGGYGYGYPGYYRYPGYRAYGYGYYPRYYYSAPPYYAPPVYRYNYYGGPYGGFEYYGPRRGFGIAF